MSNLANHLGRMNANHYYSSAHRIFVVKIDLLQLVLVFVFF